MSSRSLYKEEESMSDYSGSYPVYKKESDEEYVSADEDDDDDDVKSLKHKLSRERDTSRRTTQQMRTLMQFIEQYKKTVEAERTVIIEKAKKDEEDFKLKEQDLLDKIKELETDYDEMVDEYENKIFEINEEKKSRNKENVENLQTLLKELNYIEESNENLTLELEKQKETNDKLTTELKLSKELIAQLERKLKQQETINVRASRDLITTSGSAENLQLELQKERAKVLSIASLLGQMRSIVALDSGEEIAASSQLIEEREEHNKTKVAFEEQSKAMGEMKSQVDRLQKRIKDLHSTTLRHIHQETPASTSTFTYPTPDPKQVPARGGILRKFSDKKGTQMVTEEKIQSMFIYAEQGKLDDLQKLLKKTKGLVHAVDELGRTALHRAALNGVKTAILSLFLENGLSPNIQDIHGLSVFHSAAKCPLDNTENMKMLSKRQDVDIHQLTKANETVLHLYAKGKYLNNELFSNLASKLTNVNQADIEGDTILHNACHENHDQAVITLIKYGANANLTNNKGETPLHIAARHGFMKIVQTLVDLGGADPTIKGEKGTPLDVAMVGSPVPAFLDNAIKKRNSPRRARATISVEHVGLGPISDIKINNSLTETVPAGRQSLVPSSTDPTGETTTLRMRSTSIVFDNKIAITIHAPEMTLKTTLSLNQTVQEALTTVRKKFPDKCKDYVLVIGDKVMDLTAKLGDYPKLKESKELQLLSKEAAANATKFSTYARNSIT